jgi:tRNA 2-selenouridine synthase
MSDGSIVPLKSIDQISNDEFHIIDVRSPAEYEEFHIPGAINIPIFNNEERAQVGTTYKQIGRDEAKQLGIELVSPKLPTYFQQIKHMQGEEPKPLLVYCARGGMRSRSLASVLLMMGLKTYQLEGGIRSFRSTIREEVEGFDYLNKKFIVLEGLTGTMKTEILKILQEEGYPVLDLEGLASHRGSIFGQVGIPEKSQKQFESELYMRLQELKDSSYIIIESESRRLGRIVLPEWIMKGKESGDRIHVNCPVHIRVKHTLDTYDPMQYKKDLMEAFNRLQKYVQPDIKEEINIAFQNDNYEKIVELLFIHYYDPKYSYAADRYDTRILEITFENLEEGTKKVKEQIRKLISKTNEIPH